MNNEKIRIDENKRWVDFYGLNHDEVIGVRVYAMKAQSLGGAKGMPITEARAFGEEFTIPIPIDNFAPGKRQDDKMDFWVRYEGYMQTFPKSILDAVLRGQMSFDQLLKAAEA